MLDSARSTVWSWPRAAARREIELTVLNGRAPGGARGVKNDVVHYDRIVPRTPNMTSCVPRAAPVRVTYTLSRSFDPQKVLGRKLNSELIDRILTEWNTSGNGIKA